jgi:D-3-phosphoglycerate dehydrogenase / 2-oxoglutarate reductase
MTAGDSRAASHDRRTVTAAYGQAFDGIENEVLGPLGASVVFVDALNRDVVADADALLVTLQPVGADLLEAMPRCRIVSRAGTGVDLIDIEAATEMGIWVANVPDYAVDEVSTHALSLILAHARRIPGLLRAVEAGGWDGRAAGQIRRLRGQTLGILGFGRIGQAVAAKAAALGVRILAHDPYVAKERMAELGVEPVGFEELMVRADFITLHMPLTPETRHLIDRSALRLARPQAVLVNTARGGLVDEEALVEAVRDGRLAGAAVDVLESEPPPRDHPFLGEERIWVTPHAAWYSEEAGEEMIRTACENVSLVFRGERPLHPVNAPRRRP